MSQLVFPKLEAIARALNAAAGIARPVPIRCELLPGTGVELVVRFGVDGVPEQLARDLARNLEVPFDELFVQPKGGA